MPDTKRAPVLELYVFQDGDDRFLARISLGNHRLYAQPIVELTISDLFVLRDIATRGLAELKKESTCAQHSP